MEDLKNNLSEEKKHLYNTSLSLYYFYKVGSLLLPFPPSPPIEEVMTTCWKALISQYTLPEISEII